MSDAGKVLARIELDLSALAGQMNEAVRIVEDGGKRMASAFQQATAAMGSAGAGFASGIGSSMSAASNTVASNVTNINNHYQILNNSLNSLSSTHNTAFTSMSSVINQTQSAVSSATGRMGSALTGLLSPIGNVVSALFSLQATKAFLSKGAELENMEVAMINVEHSVQKGAKAYGELIKFAKDTPFTLDETRQAYVRLKSFGLEPNMEMLKKFGDTAAATADPTRALTTLTTQLGQAWAKQKVQGQDLKAVMEAGVPVYDILAKASGKTAKEIAELATKGKLGRDVIKFLIDEMGRINDGAMIQSMNTLNGQFSTLKDQVNTVFNAIRSSGGFAVITEQLKLLNKEFDNSVADGSMQRFGAEFAKVMADLIGVARATLNATSQIFGAFSDLWNDCTVAIGEITGKQMTLWTSFKLGLMALFEGLGFVVSALREGFQISFDGMSNIIAEWGGKTKSVMMNVVATSIDTVSSLWELAKAKADGKSEEMGHIAEAYHQRLVARNKTTDSDIAAIEQTAKLRAEENDKKREQGLLTMQGKAIKAAEAINAAIADADKPSAPKRKEPDPYETKKGSLKLPDIEAKGAATAMDKLRDQLAKEKLIHEQALLDKGIYYETALKDELKFWEAHANDSNLKGKESVALDRKISELKIQIDRQTLDKRKANLDEEISLITNNLAKKRSKLTEELAMYQQGDEGYAKTKEKINKVDIAMAKKKQEIAREVAQEEREQGLNEITSLEQEWQSKLTIGTVSMRQYATTMKKFAEEKNKLRIQEKQAELKAEEDKGDEGDLAKIAKLNRQVIQLKGQLNKELGKLDRESEKESVKHWNTIGKAMENSMRKATKDVLTGNKTLLQGLRGIWNDMLLSFIDMGEEMLISEGERKLKEVLFEEDAVTKKMSLRSMGAMMEQLLGSTTTEATIEEKGVEVAAVVTGNAAEAATGAAAAVAPTPWVGPALAIAAFAATMALCMGAMHSAEGGFDIGNYEPLTQLHAKEMVLPANLSEGFRQIISQGNTSGKSGNTTNHYTNNMNISAQDVDSFNRSSTDIHKQAVRQLRKYGR